MNLNKLRNIHFVGILVVTLFLGTALPTYAQMPGDVNCDDDISAVDAMFIWQYDVSLRASNEGCPESGDGTLYSVVGDVNGDNLVNPADAMLILQCEVLLTNVFCPDEESSASETGTVGTDTDGTDTDGTENSDGTDTDGTENSDAGDGSDETGSEDDSSGTTGAVAVGTIEITSAQNAETISIQTTASSTISAEITTNAGSGVHLAAGSFELTYEGAQLVECTVLQGACNTETPGVVRFNVVTTDGIQSDLPLVELTFDGDAAAITGFTAVGLVNSKGEPLDYEFVNGQEEGNNPLETQLFIPFVNS